jgi:hypothetical protein
MKSTTSYVLAAFAVGLGDGRSSPENTAACIRIGAVDKVQTVATPTDSSKFATTTVADRPTFEC